MENSSILGAFARLSLCLATLFAPLTVDMTFKVAVIYQLCENILFKCRNCAGVKAEPVLKRLDEPFRKNHISDTQ